MGDEGLYLPNCQINLFIAFHALSLLFCNYINATAYCLGRFEPSSPSTKELHGSCNERKVASQKILYQIQRNHSK